MMLHSLRKIFDDNAVFIISLSLVHLLSYTTLEKMLKQVIVESLSSIRPTILYVFNNDNKH